jgi:hypothetical protein
MKHIAITTTNNIPTAKINGKTHIIHKIRAKLQLTTALYCVVDCIYEFNSKFSEKQCTAEYISEYLGVPQKGVDLMLHELKEKGFVSFGKRLETTSIWNNEFNNVNIEDDFEEFWKLFNNGNKQKAKIAYLKARKLVEKDILYDAAKAYKEKCTVTGTFLMHTSSWLNPQYKYWEDDYSISVNQDDTEKKMLTGKF